MAIFLYFTVLTGQHTLSEFGGSTENGCNPHPEQGSGTSGRNGGGNTYNVTSTNGGRKGSTQGCKGRNLTLATFPLTENGAESTLQLSKLKTAETNGQDETSNQNQDDGGNSPNNIVDRREN